MAHFHDSASIGCSALESSNLIGQESCPRFKPCPDWLLASTCCVAFFLSKAPALWDRYFIFSQTDPIISSSPETVGTLAEFVLFFSSWSMRGSDVRFARALSRRWKLPKAFSWMISSQDGSAVSDNKLFPAFDSERGAHCCWVAVGRGFTGGEVDACTQWLLKVTCLFGLNQLCVEEHRLRKTPPPLNASTTSVNNGGSAETSPTPVSLSHTDEYPPVIDHLHVFCANFNSAFFF